MKKHFLALTRLAASERSPDFLGKRDESGPFTFKDWTEDEAIKNTKRDLRGLMEFDSATMDAPGAASENQELPKPSSQSPESGAHKAQFLSILNDEFTRMRIAICHDTKVTRNANRHESHALVKRKRRELLQTNELIMMHLNELTAIALCKFPDFFPELSQSPVPLVRLIVSYLSTEPLSVPPRLIKVRLHMLEILKESANDAKTWIKACEETKLQRTWRNCRQCCASWKGFLAFRVLWLALSLITVEAPAVTELPETVDGAPVVTECAETVDGAQAVTECNEIHGAH